MVRIRKIDTMLFRMIKNSKGQFMAVLIIIIVGICVYTAMGMTSLNLQNTLDSYYKENNFPNLFIETSGAPSQKVNGLVKIDGVKNVTGRILIDVPFITDDINERVNLRIITTKSNNDELSKSTLIEGKKLSDDGKEALLIEQFASARGIEPGDNIKVQVKGVQYTLDVVGILDNPEFIYLIENGQSIMPEDKNFGVCYVSEKFARQALGFPDIYNQILISYEDNVEEERLIDDVEKELKQYGVKQTVKRENQLSNSMISQELEGLDSMANSLPILFLLVAGLILMMMLGRMVKNDRLKIGVLKAIGYSNSQVLSHYIKYALLSGILGGLLGSACGMALAGGMTKLYLRFFYIPLLKINFYYSYVFAAIFLSAIFCTLSGLIGARGVLKITPADSMRSESPKTGKRILLEKVPFVWKNLSFSNKMIAKNIFRNKKRTIFVLAGVIVTYGMMLFTTSMPNVVDQMMNKHFIEFQKMDYNISLQNPVDKNAIQDLRYLIDIDYMEGKIEYPFEVANGNKNQFVSIIGLKKDTLFYDFKDSEGNEINIPRKGILLSENLTSTLKVKKGDMIQVKTFLPNKNDVYVQVKGIVKQALGMNAYMEIENMGALLLDKDIVTGAYVNSDDPNINEKLIRASNISTIMSIEKTRAVYDEYMSMMVLSIGFMFLFSGILGFCIVYNATTISISERLMEFSTLRVLGFTKNEIFMMILKENNIIMILGIIIGIPVGNGFAQYSSHAFSTDIYSLDMSPTFLAGIMAAVYTIGFVLAAQFATFRKISRLNFLEALKNRET